MDEVDDDVLAHMSFPNEALICLLARGMRAEVCSFIVCRQHRSVRSNGIDAPWRTA